MARNKSERVHERGMVRGILLHEFWVLPEGAEVEAVAVLADALSARVVDVEEAEVATLVAFVRVGVVLAH